MKLRTLIILLFVAVYGGEIFSQKKISDNTLLERVHFFKDINIDSSLYYSKKLQLSKDYCKVIEGISNESYAYYRKKDYITSENIANKLIFLSDSLISNKNYQTCFINGKISALNRIFWIRKNQENYKEAYETLSHINKANKLYKDNHINQVRNELVIMQCGAIIKNALKMEEEAKTILINSLNLIDSPRFEDVKKDFVFFKNKANINNSIGNTYLTLSKKNNDKSLLDSADYYYKKAYTLAQNFNPPHKDTDIIYSFRETEILIAKNEFQKALKLINNYKNISNGYHYKHREFFQKALCYHNLQQADSAIYYSYKLLNDKKEKCKRSNMITMYDILSKQYKNLKKTDSAYKYSQLTLEQYDLADKNEEETFQLLYKNDYQNALKLNRELTKKSNSKNYIFSGVLFITIASISMFFLFFYKKEKKSNESLIKQIEETSIKEETTKKEYNIDSELEKKILDKIDNIDSSLAYLKSDFSISYIAEKLNTNSTYISFVFNNSKGETFKQYYTRLKINYIKDKLNNDKIYRNYSVKALAEEIGYSNASAFSRAFKKQTGVTPSEFIKNLS